MIINNNDIENILEKVLYMLSFEKLVRDEQQKVKDDEQKHFREYELYKWLILLNIFLSIQN